MINEANAILGHEDIARTMVRWLRSRHLQPVRELRLESGRIADIAYVSDTGALNIIEVKSDFRPYYLDAAYRKYGPYCNYLSLAIPTCEPLLRAVFQGPIGWRMHSDEVGIIQVDMEGLHVARSPSVRMVPPARRRQVDDLLKAKLAAGEAIPGLKLSSERAAARNESGPV